MIQTDRTKPSQPTESHDPISWAQWLPKNCTPVGAAASAWVRVPAATAIATILSLTLVTTGLTLALPRPAYGHDDSLTVLRHLSAGFASIYQQMTPSVVHVHSSPEPAASTGGSAERTAKADIDSGSGVVYAPSIPASPTRRYVLTNHHVVENGRRHLVRLADGREYRATLAGSDPQTDIAVLTFNAPDVKTAHLANSDNIQVGQWVLAIGSPFGLKHSLTVGVVSGVGRTSVGINQYEDFIQTDAAINPGNSGGPLVNLDGKVVGINSTVFHSKDGFNGAGLAIPINLARRIADQLVQHGRVRRGYLGVFLQQLDGPLATMFGTDKTAGALVSEVVADSPAARAGIHVGDIVVRYRGQPVRDVGSFINELSLTNPNSAVELTVFRAGKLIALSATLEARSKYESMARNSGPLSIKGIEMFGMTVNSADDLPARHTRQSATDTGSGNTIGPGLVVTHVRPGSRAAGAGIAVGAVLLQLNRQAVNSRQQLKKQLASVNLARAALLLLRQDGYQEYVAIPAN